MFSDTPSDWSSPRAISTLSHPSMLQLFRRSYFAQRVLSVHASVLLPHGEARCFWEKLEHAARLPATRYALLQPVFIPPQPDERKPAWHRRVKDTRHAFVTPCLPVLAIHIQSSNHSTIACRPQQWFFELRTSIFSYSNMVILISENGG